MSAGRITCKRHFQPLSFDKTSLRIINNMKPFVVNRHVQDEPDCRSFSIRLQASCVCYLDFALMSHGPRKSHETQKREAV